VRPCAQQRESSAVPEEQCTMSAATISVDEFLALEQKVLQTVALIKQEREGRQAAEAARQAAEAARATVDAELAMARQLLEQAQMKITSLEQRVAAQAQEIAAQAQQIASTHAAESTVKALEQERDMVRQRVEKMLGDLDALL
jgi:chromosome segregation ATPase